MNRQAAAGALLASALAGCAGGIPSDDFRGAPLITLVGRVTSSETLPPLEVGLVAQHGDAPSMAEMSLEMRTDERLADGGWFSFYLYAPPPRSAWTQLQPGEVRFARGNAVAMHFGLHDDEVVQAAANEDPDFGADVDHWLVYLESAAPPNSLTAWWLGSPGAQVDAGYHVLRVSPFSPCDHVAVDACVLALASPIVPEETARSYCGAPYRLHLDEDAILRIHLGTYALPDPPVCSP